MVSPEELCEALIVRGRGIGQPVAGGFDHLARYRSGTPPLVTPKFAPTCGAIKVSGLTCWRRRPRELNGSGGGLGTMSSGLPAQAVITGYRTTKHDL